MNLAEAHKLIHGTVKLELPNETWTIVYDRRKDRAGWCDHAKKQLGFSIHFISFGNQYSVEQTVLHEVAHAIAGPDAAHGRVWRNTAHNLGYDGGETVKAAHNELPAWKTLSVLAVFVYFLYITFPVIVAAVALAAWFALVFMAVYSSIGPIPSYLKEPPK